MIGYAGFGTAFWFIWHFVIARQHVMQSASCACLFYQCYRSALLFIVLLIISVCLSVCLSNAGTRVKTSGHKFVTLFDVLVRASF